MREPRDERQFALRADELLSNKEWLEKHEGEWVEEPGVKLIIQTMIVAAIVVVISLFCLLSGCGGGEEPLDSRATLQPVNCAASGVCQ